MSLSARAAGFQFDAVTHFDHLLDSLGQLDRGDVAHIHWTSPIAQDAPTLSTARRRVRMLARNLRRARRRGAHLVWTVHNRLPHELRYREQEIALYRLLAQESDAVHVMTADTADVISDVCAIPSDKLRLIPHPNYQGIYDTSISRDEARASFELTPDDVAVLFLGQIRPYKGVDTLLQAVDAAARPDGRPIVLLLAGDVSAEAISVLEETLPRSIRSIVHFGFVADGDIARWFSAADIAVFPYRQILNSGSVHLAATFHVPAIIPDEPHLRSQYGQEPWAAFFDTREPVASLTALLSDPALFAGLTEAQFARFVEALSPWQVSCAYRDLLTELTS